MVIFSESRKRDILSSEREEETSSPKRVALSPGLHVKREPKEPGDEGLNRAPHVTSPDARKSPEQDFNARSKHLLENFHERPHEFRYPRLSRDISALSIRHPPMELLSNLFPHHSKSTLELILQSCHGNVVEAIEMLLSSQESRGSNMPGLGGCSFTGHSSPFIHGPMTRNVMTRPLPSTHACSPSRIYPPSPLPPPLLVKPKPEMAFKFPPIAHTSYSTDSRLGERGCGLAAIARFCSRCGHKINVFDKFCAHCGKGLGESTNGI